MRKLGLAALATLAAAGFATAVKASRPDAPSSSRTEQLRYALETMNLDYRDFVTRANDFRANGCWNGPTGCRKPAPYNQFDWTTDGCSHTPPPANLVFNRPCQLHDFGYRNFGKGLALDPTENRRKWIDDRFHDEMYLICKDPRASLPLAGHCRGAADLIYEAVRLLGAWKPSAPAFNPAAYNGHIVKQDNGSVTSWLVVDAQGHRNWIPTGEIYNCLIAAGHPGPDYLSAAQLNQLPDQNGVWASCTPPAPTPTTTTTPKPTTTTPPTTTTTPTTTSMPTTTTALSPPPPVRVVAYDNYGSANAGRAMCRGNPGNSSSMPGGTATQTFTVGSGVAAIDEVLVQIDPDSSVTGHASLFVNGAQRASADATAAGDTTFTFSRVAVAAGDQVRFNVAFTASSGKIITVYTAGSPGGQFTTSNSCPAGAPSVSLTSTGLRAVVRGWNR